LKNIGFVSWWFNRGQAVVTRYIKSIFDEAGYNTFVLVRNANHQSTKGDWAGDNITIGSRDKNIDPAVYIKWAKDNNIEVCFFDQNYQFKAIKALRSTGVKTIGRFVWEQFGAKHVIRAKSSFDLIYSLTNCEHKRYLNSLKINSQFVRWGIHPSLLEYDIEKRSDGPIWFYYPAGFCTQRKAVNKTLQAFSSVKNKDIRLLVSSQKRIRPINDSRIKIHTGNITTHQEFHKLMHSCDVCIIPSRWEGLGLAFVEAMAFDMPIIATSHPPMNEYIIPGETGYLIDCYRKERIDSGILAANFSTSDFVRKVSRIADRQVIDKMSKNTRNILHKRYDWNNTVEDYKDLIRKVCQ
tara:strand:- start:35559 stop:36614 length:1056 start_codon:yes stop_codon:yes gene_type:complete